MTSTLPRVSSESPTDSRVLTDGLITLRPHLPHDLAAIVEQCQDPETARFTSVPQPYTVQNGIGFLDEVTLAWSAGEPGTPRAWAIETPDDRGVPRYAGTCDYRPQGHGAAAVGIVFQRAVAGAGGDVGRANLDAMAAREGLDNLTFVINCNLQRLDGPVRGNGKIIQELEGIFRGAGWNVIKVIWGRLWDPLFARDESGLLQKRMDEVCDGEYQNYKFNGGAYTREHFFGKYPETLELVKDLSDDDIMYLNRGGHDPYKVYAAYHEAFHHKGQPTVILAKTVKGYGMGASGEAANETHSVKKMDLESLKKFRTRFGIPLRDDELKSVPYYRPAPDSPEMVYMRQRREALGGFPMHLRVIMRRELQ